MVWDRKIFIEGLRMDSLYLFNFRVSQLVSIALVVLGIIGFVRRVRYEKTLWSHNYWFWNSWDDCSNIFKRGGVSPLIIEESAPGGQLNKINVIENYPGFEKTDGPSLAFDIYNQVRKLDIEYLFDKVTKTDFTNNIKVYTSKLELTCDYLVIATGKISKKLFSDDDRYIGSGISYCALCDSHLYKDKDVVVVGGGNSALEEALYLSNICKNVTVINKNEKFRGEKVLIDEINEKIILNVCIILQ